MQVEMGDEGLNILGITRDQVAMLAEALKETSSQEFMNDEELRKLFKMLAVLQSDLWDEMTSGSFDFNQFTRQ